MKPNGGWCWFQELRALLPKDGKLVFSTISCQPSFDQAAEHIPQATRIS